MTKGFGVIRFYKMREYQFIQRDQAEEDLKTGLNAIVATKTDLSTKAREWLREIDVLTHSWSSEQFWKSVQISEARN